MRCPNCNTELPDDARVCGRCRTRLTSGAPGKKDGGGGFVPPAEDFTSQPTRTDPSAINTARHLMRHPTGLITGVDARSIENEIAKASSEVHGPGALDAMDELDDSVPSEFEGDATVVDPALAARLGNQVVAHAPRDAPRKAPLTMMTVDEPVRPVRATPGVPITSPSRAGSTEPFMPAANLPPPAEVLPPDDGPAAAGAFPWQMAVGAAVVTVLIASAVVIFFSRGG